ncbi:MULTISPECIES: D-alanyl-D-alanine carboxypeptidase/D-alanyl-D-alanine endopeptidase [Dyella]|nr:MULTISPECIES: D-alanyl-D-alanine carboxypeptidase/D-alanyl-D-alanine-endopeptidase [Dyella]
MRFRPCAAWLFAAALTTPVFAGTLAQDIDAHIAQPRFEHARWGIEVIELGSGRVVYAHDAGKLFTPASTNKLYTAALALHVLGPAFRFPTRVFGAAPDHGGTITGDAVLYGMGDPTLGTATLTADWSDQMAVQMTSLGIRRIRGDLVADDTFFSTPPYGSGWEADDLQAAYGAPPSALTVNDNVVQVTVAPGASEGLPADLTLAPSDGIAQLANQLVTTTAGTRANVNLVRPAGARKLYAFGQVPAGSSRSSYRLAVDDPARIAGSQLLGALQRHGIRVDGIVRVAHWPQDSGALRHNTTMLAEVQSPPVIDILRDALKRSQNLYMQNLLLMAGVRTQATEPAPADRPGFINTEDWGIIGLRKLLDAADVPADEYQYNEGSGLARADLTTPHAMNRLLALLAAQPNAGQIMDTLPVAGIDGTLKSRMKGTAAEGNVRAKTGTLSQVRSLAGYVTTAHGQRLAFTIFLNHYDSPEGAPAATADIDAIAVRLANEGRP